MDGTIVDSDAAVERAWAAWAQLHGVDLAAVLPIAHAAPAAETTRRLLPDFGPDEVSRAAAMQLELQYDDLADVVPTCGAERLLEVLEQRRMPCAVVTSADRWLAGARLGAAGIEAPVLVTFEEVAAGKPDPEEFLLAGRAAGAMTAALKGLDADLRLADLGELADLLAAVVRS
jgi:sugar-phosphatase